MYDRSPFCVSSCEIVQGYHWMWEPRCWQVKAEKLGNLSIFFYIYINACGDCEILSSANVAENASLIILSSLNIQCRS